MSDVNRVHFVRWFKARLLKNVLNGERFIFASYRCQDAFKQRIKELVDPETLELVSRLEGSTMLPPFIPYMSDAMLVKYAFNDNNPLQHLSDEKFLTLIEQILSHPRKQELCSRNVERIVELLGKTSYTRFKNDPQFMKVLLEQRHLPVKIMLEIVHNDKYPKKRNIPSETLDRIGKLLKRQTLILHIRKEVQTHEPNCTGSV